MVNDPFEELVNYVIKSTQNLVIIDPKTHMPESSGSGCFIRYKDRTFLVSVQHLTDKVGKQTAIDTGIRDEKGTLLYALPAFNYVEEFNFDDIDLDNLNISNLKSLDICYTEIFSPIDSIHPNYKFDDMVIKSGSKQIVLSNLDYSPTDDKQYCFFGLIKGKLYENKLFQEGKFVMGLKYDRQIGPYDRFIIKDKIENELEFKGLSGSPIFSDTGEPVALVAHGIIGENYLYGFSFRELRKYLDIHISLSPDTPLSKSLDNLVSNRVDFPKEIYDKDVKYITPNFDLIDAELNSKYEKLDNKEFKLESIFEHEKIEPYISYQILYGTNRKSEIVQDNVSFSNLRDGILHLGVCNVSIPYSHKMGKLERPGWFEKLFFKESPKNNFTILKNVSKNETEFIDVLKNRIGESNHKDVLIFIHGYNVAFNESMFRSAQLGYDLNFKGVVTAFSWPSNGSVTGYVADTDTAKLSSLYLCEFIKKILNSSSIKKMHIIAHSMGNIVLTEALIQLRKENLFPHTIINQIILAAPDIDKDVFVSQIMPQINRDFGLTLYASSKDKALIASKLLRKDFKRVGEGGQDIVIIDGLFSVDASKVDTSLLGHGYFSDTQMLLNDIHMTLSDIHPDNRILDSIHKTSDGKTMKYWAFRKS
jgi:esterase/lipase superfamily enzyme